MQLLLKDTPVLEIQENGTCTVLEFERLPFSLRKEKVTFIDFIEWASNRTLSIGRSYAKEILNTLRLSQTNRYAVCKACRGLSLEDAYWIRQDGDRKTGSLVPAFCEAYYQSTQTPIVAVSASEGDTTVQDWGAGKGKLEDAAERLAAAVEFIDQSGTYRVRHVLAVWCQGEADAEVGTVAADYIRGVEALFGALFRRGLETCLVIQTGASVAKPVQYEIIREAQLQLCSENDRFVMISDAFAGLLEMTAEDGGYDPFLQIVSFNGESDQIFYGADSGGSGGFGFYFAYNAQGKELFSSQKFAVPYTAAYADGFRVRVENTETGDTVYLDLSGRDESYLSQIYNADGTLIKPLSCDVSGANAVSPFYLSEGRYGLEIYARVTGLYNADVVGWIIMRASLEGGAFEPFFSVVGAYGG